MESLIPALAAFLTASTLIACHPITKRDIPTDWRSLIGDDVFQYYTNESVFRPDQLFEGDIKGIDTNLGSNPQAAANLAQNAVLDRNQLWPRGTIPYTIGSGFTSQQRSIIEGSLRDIMSKTCLKFVTRTNERDYIQFVNRNAGCSSYVARTGGPQQIDLQEGCIYHFGEVQHEVMHALGFFHEQSRKDRDDFVTIAWSNIRTDNHDQFEKYQSNLLGLPYDYDSIMHYGWNYFAVDRAKPTIVPKKKASIGNRKLMSAMDVQKINILYQCSGAGAPAPAPAPSSGTGSFGSGSSSGSRGTSGGSIWDVILGGSGSAPAPAPAPVTARPTEAPRTSAPSGIKGALTSFLSGLFG